MGETVLNGDSALLTRTFPYCAIGGEVRYEKPGYAGGGFDFNNDEGSDPKYFSIQLWPLEQKTIKVVKRTPTNIDNIRKRGAGAIALYSTQFTELNPNETVMISVSREKEDQYDEDVPVVGFMAYKPVNSTSAPPTKDDQKNQIIKLFNDGKNRFCD